MTLSTLVNLLQTRAAQQPNKIAYTFLENGETPRTQLTYRQLDQQAKAIATYLQSQLSPGDRVILVYPQSLEAITALFGCLYAGVIAIPAPAPETTRLKRTLPRLEAIAADAGAALILTTSSLLSNSNRMRFTARSFVRLLNGQPSLLLNYYLDEAEITQNTPQLATIPWTATDKIPTHLASQWQPPQINGDTIAYLQYTSGSTSTPKGVILDHHNLMGHLAELQQAAGYDSHSITVTWMPYFHDYGLVEGILEPLYNGTPCYLMSPLAFLKQPKRWLKAISTYRATHSQAPNFAYAYCLRRITPAARFDLDLSSWQAAGNAAEPINPAVIEEFSQTFAPFGFRPQTFAPAYGLAEATLLVTTSRKQDPPIICTVSTAALAENRVVETATGQKLVGSGRFLDKTQVVIVHPETLTRCPPHQIGEIWVASAGVARGYWQRRDATQETFGAYLTDTGEGPFSWCAFPRSGNPTGVAPFLRTGDLGFIHQGELFVTGRLKDLIIIHGENHYPQDIEWVVEQSHPALRPGYGAAFAINIDGVEQLVVAFEVERKAIEEGRGQRAEGRREQFQGDSDLPAIKDHQIENVGGGSKPKKEKAKRKGKNLNTEEVVNAIRIGIAEQCELSVYSIVLLKRGSILKTSSGKIQRQACRKAFLEGSLESVASWTITALLKPSGDNLGGFSELKDQQRHSRAELAPAQAWGGNPLNPYKTLSNQPSNIPDDTEPDSPQDETEKWLAVIWQRVLGIESINRKDNFFELGGDSLKAAVVVSEIEKAFGQQIPVESVAAAKTIETLAHQITQNYWDTIGSRTLVPANPQGRKRPLFYVHAIGGRGGGFMLARYLDPERPVYGLQAVGVDGKTAPHTQIQDMVEHYIQEIQTVQPHGPYLLGGQCIGGNIALEMAQQLKQRGEQVLLVAMSDSPNPLITTEQKNQQWTHWKLYGKAHQREKFKKQGLTDNLIENILKVSEANWQVIISHCPKIYSGRVVHFSAVENRQQPNRSMFDPMQPNGWNQFVAGGLKIIEVPGGHNTFHTEPHVQVLAAKLNACLEQVESKVQAQSTAIPILSH